MLENPQDATERKCKYAWRSLKQSPKSIQVNHNVYCMPTFMECLHTPTVHWDPRSLPTVCGNCWEPVCIYRWRSWNSPSLSHPPVLICSLLIPSRDFPQDLPRGRVGREVGNSPVLRKELMFYPHHAPSEVGTNTTLFDWRHSRVYQWLLS